VGKMITTKIIHASYGLRHFLKCKKCGTVITEPEELIKIVKPNLNMHASYKIVKKQHDARDTINKAREIAIAELDKKDIPEMAKLKIVYDNGKWVLDSGECWKPLGSPRIIRFYKYDKSTGKWKLIKDWSVVISNLIKDYS
jgi:hypothetical protein